MAILKVARLGHPVLTTPAQVIDPAVLGSVRIQQLIDDMIETMYDERGVGLAAPQVHESLRLFVMDPGEELGGGLQILVNPVLDFPDEERMELWEGCLSIPGIRGVTERHRSVEVRFLDRHGESRQVLFEDFPAAVVQHETDHLDGVLFLRRMPDLSRLSYEEEYGRYHAVYEDDPDEPGDE